MIPFLFLYLKKDYSITLKNVIIEMIKFHQIKIIVENKLKRINKQMREYKNATKKYKRDVDYTTA